MCAVLKWSIQTCEYLAGRRMAAFITVCFADMNKLTIPALPLLQGSWLTLGLKIFLQVPGVADRDKQGSGGKEATCNLWCTCSPHSHVFFLLLLLSTHQAETYTGKEQKAEQTAHNPCSLIPLFMPDCRTPFTGYWAIAWTPRYVNPLCGKMVMTMHLVNPNLEHRKICKYRWMKELWL